MRPPEPHGSLKARYFLEYLGFRLVAGLVRLMPLDMASALMGRAWRWIAPKTFRQKRALDNLALALPELDAGECRRITHGMWDNLGRVFAETLQLDRLAKDRARRVSGTLDHLSDQIDAAGGHAVLVTLHMGNWECAILPATNAGLNPIGVYRQVNNPYVDRYLRRMRDEVFPAGLLSKGHDTARKVLGHLRERGSLGIVGDLREPRGVEVNFFGHDASANEFPAMLARHCRVPFIAGRCVRTDGARFEVDTVAVDYPVTDDRKADVAAAMQALHDVFEGWIRERPDQWMWSQRKWAAGRSDRRQRIREFNEARSTGDTS